MNSNENGDYFENKPTLKIEDIYSEETFKNVGNENEENFEEDDRTNLKHVSRLRKNVVLLQ